MTLDQLPPGRRAVVLSVQGEKEEALRCRLLDMGFTPGAVVSIRGSAPLGDPLLIRLRGYELALRRQDARRITIKEE